MTDRGGAGSLPTPPAVLVRLGATIVAAASVLAGKALIGSGLRRAPEGWRRTVGILLRSEATRFALSAFALRVPPADTPDSIEANTARALQRFLSGEPDAHFALEWRRPVTMRRSLPFVDLVLLQFGPDGALAAIVPFLAASPAAPAPDVQGDVHAAVVAAYNRTHRFREVERPGALLDQVRATLASGSGASHRGAAEAYAQRLLAACCLSFEWIDPADPAQRFCPPRFTARRTLGFGYLLCVARPDAALGSVDLWVSAQHVGLDGVPLQDLLGRLERAWGTTEAVTFPAASAGEAFAGPLSCHAPGERPVDHLITFVDFSPVLALRRRLSAQHAAAIGGEVTFGTLLAWLLSQEPEFTGLRIASTVDVAASGGYERDVDVVPLRPADYATGGPWGGFVEFAREFNRLIAASRTRTSPLRAAMQMAGLIPAWAHQAIVQANPARLDDTFGSLCITIIREGRVFIAPMTDLGLGHGFLAIGNVALPAADGRRVASVSIKGEAGRIAHYPAILRRMMVRAAELQVPGF